MENRICAAILLCLVLAWCGPLAVAPARVIHESQLATLQGLEEQFVRSPTDRANTARLAATYLKLRRPQLAIGLVRSVSATLREDPAISHQLARAYEATGRIPDALATADLAYARCARALGSDIVSMTTGVPTYACSERTLASLERHLTALGHMRTWGVQSARDPRSALAYRLSERRVSLASYREP